MTALYAGMVLAVAVAALARLAARVRDVSRHRPQVEPRPGADAQFADWPSVRTPEPSSMDSSEGIESTTERVLRRRE